MESLYRALEIYQKVFSSKFVYLIMIPEEMDFLSYSFLTYVIQSLFLVLKNKSWFQI